MNKFISCLFLSLVLSGCGTMITVPIDHSVISPETATVIVFHEQGFTDKFKVYADGKQVGTVTSEEPLKFEVPPGEHELHSRTSLLVDRVTKQNFEPGKTYFMELRVEQGVWVSSIWIDPTYPRETYEVKSFRQ